MLVDRQPVVNLMKKAYLEQVSDPLTSFVGQEDISKSLFFLAQCLKDATDDQLKFGLVISPDALKMIESDNAISLEGAGQIDYKVMAIFSHFLASPAVTTQIQKLNMRYGLLCVICRTLIAPLHQPSIFFFPDRLFMHIYIYVILILYLFIFSHVSVTITSRTCWSWVSWSLAASGNFCI